MNGWLTDRRHVGAATKWPSNGDDFAPSIITTIMLLVITMQHQRLQVAHTARPLYGVRTRYSGYWQQAQLCCLHNGIATNCVFILLITAVAPTPSCTLTQTHALHSSTHNCFRLSHLTIDLHFTFANCIDWLLAFMPFAALCCLFLPLVASLQPFTALWVCSIAYFKS